MRRFGHALKGEMPVCHPLLSRGQRISAIAPISCDGLVECELISGTVNGDQFVQGRLNGIF